MSKDHHSHQNREPDPSHRDGDQTDGPYKGGQAKQKAAKAAFLTAACDGIHLAGRVSPCGAVKRAVVTKVSAEETTPFLRNHASAEVKDLSIRWSSWNHGAIGTAFSGTWRKTRQTTRKLVAPRFHHESPQCPKNILKHPKTS